MKALINFFKGMVIGVANVIPGLSGGTMAVVLDIYDNLISSISNLTKNLKKNILFLLPIGLGAGIGILAFSNLIKFLLANYNMATNFFFIGLVIGSIPLIFKKATEKKFKAGSLIPFFIALILVVAMEIIVPPSENGTIITTLTLSSFIFLFVAGFIGAVSMVIPGISGSFVLLLIGVYSSIITAIADLNILILIPVAIGVILGIFASSKLIDSLLKKHPQGTYFAILGFIAGSIYALYPGFAFSTQGIISIVVLIIGFAMSYISSRS